MQAPTRKMTVGYCQPDISGGTANNQIPLLGNTADT